MNKVISFSFLIYPFISYLTMSYLDVKFSWFYSEYYIEASTLYSIICFALFVMGLFKLLDKSKYYVTLLISFVFMCYQLFSWSFKSTNFTDKMEVNEYSYFVTSSQRAGAAGEDFVNVVLVNKVNNIFIKENVLKTIAQTSEAKILKINKEKRVISILYELQNVERAIKTIEIKY